MTYPPPESLPIACERFDRSQPSLFDFELDQIVCAGALERKSLRGFDNVVGAPARFTVASNVFREDLVSDASRSIGRHRSIVCALSTAVFGGAGWPLPRIVAELNDRCWSVYLAERNTPLFEYFAAHMEAGALHLFGVLRRRAARPATSSTGSGTKTFRRRRSPTRRSISSSRPRCSNTSRTRRKPSARSCASFVRAARMCSPFRWTRTATATRSWRSFSRTGPSNSTAQPVYHGDPYRAEGILAYRIFSVADLERRFAAAGGDCVTWRFWSKALGILGSDSWVHVVSKS